MKKTTIQENIIRVVSNASGITEADILAPNRGTVDASNARDVVYYLIRKKTSMTLTAIGKLLGGRTHAAPFCGVRRAKDRMQTKDRAFCSVLKAAKLQLNEEETL